jgi:DNA-binding NarL/FixJ family response regulator
MSRHSSESVVFAAALADADRSKADLANIRILVVSHIRLYREALAGRLAENDSFTILGAVDHENALFEVQRLEPDLLLLDMGEWHALDLAATLLKQRAALRIVAIAVPERASSAIAIWQGIAGIVPRDGSIEDVISEVARLTRAPRIERVAVPAPEPARRAHPPVIEEPSRTGALTARECEILEVIELGLSNKEIARKLGIEVGTVKNHVHNILEKLNVRRRNQAAHRVRVRVWSDTNRP